MKRNLYILLLVLLFSNCTETKKKDSVTIGNYTFNFPSDFEVIKEKGINAGIGKIKSASLTLDFEFGANSYKLVSTSQEYLESKAWLQEFIDNFNQERPDKVNVSMITVVNVMPVSFDSFVRNNYPYRNAPPEYIAVLKWHSNANEFEYAFEIPEFIRQHIIKKDTIQNCLRKIVIAKNPMKGITGIYMQRLKEKSEIVNDNSALSIYASKINKEQQDLILKVFATVKVE